MDTRRNIPLILAIITLSLLAAALACTAITGPQNSIVESEPMCTPPLCARNEEYACDGDCPGGCGTYCAMFTPAPHPMYPSATLVDVSLSDSAIEISMDVPGIKGEFYGVVSREEFTCTIQQPDQFPERLTCTGELWNSDGTLTLRVYRNTDDMQAFTLDFLVP